MMSVLPIIVLYNVDYHATTVYQSLLSHYTGRRVVLYENSPEPLNAHYASETISYFHDSANGGVSAAYNYGAQLARQMDGIEALLLLDEDTHFEPDYISILEQQLLAHPDIDLFLPQVLYQGNQPFSPIHRGLRRCRGALLQEGCYGLGDYLPVNTGACIRQSAFRRVGGYNPDIRLDFADFDFFSRLGELSPKFYVVNSTAHQSFSNSETDSDRLFRRYQFYLEGARVARLNRHIRTIVSVEVLRHTLALSLRTRSLRFLGKYLFR